MNGGHFLCFLAGISYPLWMLYDFLPNLSTFFIGFFESLIENFYISLPELITFIGGITSMIEWQLERIKFLETAAQLDFYCIDNFSCTILQYYGIKI